MVGGLLVTLAAVGTFAAYAASNSGPAHAAVVPVGPLRAGQRLRAEDLRIVAVDLPPEQLEHTFASPAELEGAVTLVPVEGDELVNRSAVLTAPSGLGPDAPASGHELSFALERERALDGRIKRGEQIDLVATYGTGSEAYTTVVARRVRVLETDLGSGSVGSSGRVTITVMLGSEAQVLEATHALEVAKVTVVRATGADPAGDDPQGTRYRPAAASSSGAASGGSPSSDASAPRSAANGSSTAKGEAPGTTTTTQDTAAREAP